MLIRVSLLNFGWSLNHSISDTSCFIIVTKHPETKVTLTLPRYGYKDTTLSAAHPFLQGNGVVFLITASNYSSNSASLVEENEILYKLK